MPPAEGERRRVTRRVRVMERRAIPSRVEKKERTGELKAPGRGLALTKDLLLLLPQPGELLLDRLALFIQSALARVDELEIWHRSLRWDGTHKAGSDEQNEHLGSRTEALRVLCGLSRG